MLCAIGCVCKVLLFGGIYFEFNLVALALFDNVSACLKQVMRILLLLFTTYFS